MTIARVKQHFTHKGKSYKPGDNFEGEDHEIQTLAGQGHLEHPGSQTIGQQHGSSGQAQGAGAPHPETEKQGESGHSDPSKQR
jgi:hypothetical protein